MKNKTGSVIHRLVPLLLLIIAFALVAGCVHLNQFSVTEMPGDINHPLSPKASRYFNGLQTELAAAAASNQTLRLLIVHGMGVSEPGYSTNLVDRVAAKLNLKITSETNVQATNDSVLTIRTFGNGPSNLCAYELTWSSLTTPIKTNQFALDFQTPQVKSRQLVNNSFKTNLVDRSLSDVVLYIGRFRPQLQAPIINAIHLMDQDSTNNDPIAIITHSLGSYMVMDTLSTMDASVGDKTAANYVSRIKQVFMMANQLPLLDLSDQTNFDGEQSGMMAKFLNLHEKGISKHGKKSHPVLQIVAFSDPNDLLSFNLRKHDIMAAKEAGIKVRGFNVNYTVEHWSIAGVLSWPAGAHDNWWTDSRVPELLVNGHLETQSFQDEASPAK